MINTKTRYIPSGYKQFSPEMGDYPKDMFACWVNLDDPDKPKAMFFTGKQGKPTWNYWFSSIESMKKQIKETIFRVMSYEEMKIKRKEEKKEKEKRFFNELKIGDLFSYSWGYEQTNVDFYQVVDIKGKTFKIKRVASKTIEGSTYGMSDERCAIKDAFLDEERYPPIIKRSIYMPFGILSKTTESEGHYCSWYY